VASMGLSIDEQKAVERFKTDVVEPSMSKLVVLDFHAEWCGPCKALAPMLEKVATEYADKGVVLKKVDVDAEKFIAAQFQVQSIPTVYAMFQGQPVADLTNARSESQLKQTLDQILAQLPLDGGGDNGAAGGQQQQQQDVSQFVTMAEQVLAEGDAERAAGVFGQVVQMAPDNAAAHAGLVRALVQAGHVEQAQAALSAAEANPAVAADPQIEQAKTALELAGNKVDDGQLAALRQRVETDREWNEGAARAKLLQMFEAVGLEDPWVVATRRRLSRLLFG